MSEHIDQVRTVGWFRATFRDVLIFAIPNGGQRSRTAGYKLKLEGVVAGVPDLFIPEWRLFVEMKKEGGRLSPAQKELIPVLEDAGYTVLVPQGFEQARDMLLAFSYKRRTKQPSESWDNGGCYLTELPAE